MRPCDVCVPMAWPMVVKLPQQAPPPDLLLRAHGDARWAWGFVFFVRSCSRAAVSLRCTSQRCIAAYRIGGIRVEALLLRIGHHAKLGAQSGTAGEQIRGKSDSLCCVWIKVVNSEVFKLVTVCLSQALPG